MISSYDSGKSVGKIQTFGYNSWGQLTLSSGANYSSDVVGTVSADTTTYEYPDATTPNYSKTTTWGTEGGQSFSTYTYDNKNSPFWGVDPRGNINNVTSWTTHGGRNHTLTKSGIYANDKPSKQYYAYEDCGFR